MSVIHTDSVSKKFGDIQAVKNLSISVEEGQLFGFIGPNGAGKTTSINILTGQETPSSGECRVMGLDPVKKSKEVRKKVGILPEREDPPSFMTPREYLEFVCSVRGVVETGSRIKEWADLLSFNELLDTLNKSLSKGQKQKIMVAQAFIHEPELVFIDEPLINLDPVMQERLKSFFVDYVGEGNTVFLSTHVLSLADEICSHIGILEEGELVVSGEKSDVKKEDETLSDTFLRVVDDKSY